MKETESNKVTTALDERLDREAHFHDAKYAGEDLYPKHYSVRPTQFVYERMREKLGDISGKSVLEYGCGEGWITLDLAKMGGRIFAFDISPQAIESTARVLERANLRHQCHLDVMPGEALKYDDNSIDVAVGFAIIHHLDLSLALQELYRVLRPGGIAVFAEPLATNPAIRLYRHLTPQYRTPDERPLVISELPKLLNRFESFTHEEYFLTTLAALAIAYVPGGSYIYPPISRVLHKIDRQLLQALPSLGSWAWYSVITVKKAAA